MNFLFPYMGRWSSLNWTRYHQIFTHLARLGHNVHIIQPPPSSSRETSFQEVPVAAPDNLYIHEVYLSPIIWNGRFPFDKLIKKAYYSVKCVRQVKEIISKFKIDILFLYNIPQYPLVKVRSCIKVFDVADDYIAMLKEELGRFRNPLVLKVGELLLNGMIRRSDITLAVSNVLATFVRRLGNKTPKILPNGADLDERQSGFQVNTRKRHRNPIIGFVGSFEYFVDFELILNAAERLKDYTFVLVGTGRSFPRVEKQVKLRGLENVVLPGGVPHTDVARYVDAMDICLNVFKKTPVSHGACPIKLFEYLARRKPVISTRLEGVKHIDRGFLFYADTVYELEHAINEIITNDELVARCTEKGYHIVKQQYQWGNIVKKLLDVVTSRGKAGFSLFVLGSVFLL